MAVVAADAGAAVFAAAFFAAAPVTPFLMLLIIDFLGAAVVFLPAPVFLTTVEVLASLVSLLSLTLRPARVAGRDAGAIVRRVLVAAVVPLELELALEAVVTFREAAARVAFAFSTILERTLVAAADLVIPEDFNGEVGRAICDLEGDAGRSLFIRELEEVGDKTCVGRMFPVSAPRALFLTASPFSTSFSLSPEIS